MFHIRDVARRAKLLDTLQHPKILRLLRGFEVSQTGKWYLFIQSPPFGSVSYVMKINKGEKSNAIIINCHTSSLFE